MSMYTRAGSIAGKSVDQLVLEYNLSHAYLMLHMTGDPKWVTECYRLECVAGDAAYDTNAYALYTRARHLAGKDKGQLFK